MSGLAFQKILGIPIIMWGGGITFLLFLAAAVLGFMIMKGKTTIPVKWHFYLAGTVLILGLFHALFGASSLMGGL